MKKIKYILGVIAIAFTLQSCESLLEQDNPNNVTTSAAVSDLSGIEKINRGYYTGLPFGLEFYNQSLITDELNYNSQANQGGGKQHYGWDYGPGTIADRDDMAGLYRGYYQVINRSNIVISNIDKIEPKTDTEKNLKALFKAEAYGMRAYAHFMLLRNFAPKYNPTALGVAYKVDNNDRDNPARLTMEQSYAKVLEDINLAYSTFPSTLPANYGGASRNNRLTKEALAAIKAKIALEIGNYDDAITYSTQAIGSRKLVSNQTDFNDLWSDVSDFEEVILKRVSIQGAGATPGSSFLYSTGQIQWNISNTLLSKYSVDDLRAKMYYEGNVGNLKITTGKVPSKYLMPFARSVKPVFGLADLKIIRTADIVLVKAEAHARKNDLANALIEYKKVRDARNAGSSPAFISQADALDKILDERFRELAYEGSRLNDLKRFNKTIKRDESDKSAAFPNLLMTDVNKMTYAIPIADIFANPNMVQNPGW